MKALCDGIGVECYYVHANSNSANPSHQWNEVKVDGNWYIVDVQCNDSSGFYAFFLVSDSTYAGMTGMDWDRQSVPPCPKDYQDSLLLIRKNQKRFNVNGLFYPQNRIRRSAYSYATS